MIPESWAIIIPLYQGGDAARRFLLEIPIDLRSSVCIVNDGSRDGLVEELKDLEFHWVHHQTNRGKSAALCSGFEWALGQGKLWAISMDADGQHAWADLNRFIESWHQTKAELYLGQRQFWQRMPWPRIASNTLTSWLMSIVCGQKLLDSQCGYRLYQLEALAQIKVDAQGFQWESEVLFALSQWGAKVCHVPVQTIYGDEVSTIRPWRDTGRFMKLYWRLLQKKMGL